MEIFEFSLTISIICENRIELFPEILLKLAIENNLISDNNYII